MSAIDPSPPDPGNPPKRTRVLLSCGTCRASKLKCDRQDPCGQCLKKGRPDACQYAPRPQKPQKPAKTMAARLRRLEGMVREMLDEDGGETGGCGPPQGTDAGGQVVRGDMGATSYVGGTHFAAILQDVSFFPAPQLLFHLVIWKYRKIWP